MLEFLFSLKLAEDGPNQEKSMMTVSGGAKKKEWI